MTEVLTTEQAAKICKVSARIICKWFDSGRLRGYRVPGSNSRRIPLDELRVFMEQHGLPLDIPEPTRKPLAEQIVDTIISGALVRATCAEDPNHPCILTWSANVHEQIQETINQYQRTTR